MEPPRAEPPHKHLIDEVLRKVGRNLVIYQQIERLLQACALHGLYSGSIEEVQAQLHGKLKSTERKPMGPVGAAALDALFAEFGGTTVAGHGEPDIESTSFMIRTGITSATAGQRAALQQQLATVLEHRNRLAHQLLDHWSMGSEDSTAQLSTNLDAERLTALRVRDHLQSVVATTVECLQAGMQAFSEHCVAPSSGDRGLQALAVLQRSAIVQRLVTNAADTRRPNNWTSLADAGRILWQELPQEMEAMKQDFGLRTLRDLVRAACLFETKSEPTPGGGTRELYRFDPTTVGTIEVHLE